MRTQGDPGSIHGLGRSPAGGHGNPLQYSCLENPYGQRSLVGSSPWGRKESDTTEQLNAHTHWHLKTFWQVLCQAVYNLWVCLGNLKWTQEGFRGQQPASWALSCTGTGLMLLRPGAGCRPRRTRVCTHMPLLQSVFFQGSHGLTSTPAALPEDRQALELHLFLARGCTF